MIILIILIMGSMPNLKINIIKDSDKSDMMFWAIVEFMIELKIIF